MRVSEHYGLGVKQPELDFVDVDIRGDAPLFIDPRALLLLDTEWGQECVSLVQNFFGAVLNAIHAGDKARTARLLGQLREPNDTRLGFSQGRAAGRGLGEELAGKVLDALMRSEAVKSRLLTDLEDTILLIEYIGPDRISDITTNVIRQPLIHYTQDAAADHGIALVNAVASGPMWDPAAKQWVSDLVPLLRADNRRLILVPKIIVRRQLQYDSGEYFQHYVLEQMQEDEIARGTELVKLLKKDGTPRVTKKSLIEKYGKGKSVSARITSEHPQILTRYRKDKAKPDRPLVHNEVAAFTGTDVPDFDALLANVKAVKPGRSTANAYHDAVMALMTALFYPALSMPKKETQLHGGHKRVDTTYANTATPIGFFWWLKEHHPASHVFIECKNYTGDPANPELDQLSGRFSPSRGKFGILACRRFKDKAKFIAACRATAVDDRGFIIALDDDDLQKLVEARKAGDATAAFPYLRERFNELVM